MCNFDGQDEDNSCQSNNCKCNQVDRLHSDINYLMKTCSQLQNIIKNILGKENSASTIFDAFSINKEINVVEMTEEIYNSKFKSDYGRFGKCLYGCKIFTNKKSIFEFIYSGNARNTYKLYLKDIDYLIRFTKQVFTDEHDTAQDANFCILLKCDEFNDQSIEDYIFIVKTELLDKLEITNERL